MALIEPRARPAVFSSNLPWPPTVDPNVVDNEGDFQAQEDDEVEVQVQLQEEDLD